MRMWDQDKYIKAWNFASQVHGKQLVPGSEYPYLNHIGNVTMEVMTTIAKSGDIQKPNLLVQCALLHDVIEDTETSFADVKSRFGTNVANGVLALTKNLKLTSKHEQMLDSLERIREQPQEVWMVKLADRITNLQPPPHYWNKEKIQNYRKEARLILEQLGEANQHLADRLEGKIKNYVQYVGKGCF